MSGSSDEALARLARVGVKQVAHLLSILSSAEMRKPALVRRAYQEQAQHYDETLDFLCRVSWVTSDGDVIGLTSPALDVCALLKDERLLRERILAALTSTRSPYRSPVAGYIRKFGIDGGRLRYRPSLAERVSEKPIRDLLMDLRAVSYSLSDETYELAPSARSLYVWAQNVSGPRSLAMYEAAQKRRHDLGFAAELSIVNYEKARVGDGLAWRVEHTSADQPFACYDIKSVTVDGEKCSERYIEVKAVPPESLQFYWSRSEIEAAQVLREQYFLYLLPYRVGSGFELNDLVVIADPYASLYCERGGWEIEENVVICRKHGVTES